MIIHTGRPKIYLSLVGQNKKFNNNNITYILYIIILYFITLSLWFMSMLYLYINKIIKNKKIHEMRSVYNI